MILFRTDGNSEIGSGHIMRCLSIAKALRGVDEESIFALSDNSMKQAVEANGFKCAVLNSTWNNLETEVTELQKLLKLLNPKKVIVDSYFASKKYLKTISDFCYTVYMDDFAQEVYPVNAVINYNISADENFYNNHYSSDVKLLIGTKFAPLRDEFKNVKYELRHKISNIFVSTGGADPFNVASFLANELFVKKEYSDIAVQIIAGALNPNTDELKRISQTHKNIIINQNVTDMVSIMKKCDIAISASGSTLCELCAVGVPTICYVFADNQLAIAEAFSKKEIMFYAGDLRNGKEKLGSSIRSMIDALTEKSTRACKSTLAKSIIDGKGASRISDFLMGD